jgi:hypothetical protein
VSRDYSSPTRSQSRSFRQPFVGQIPGGATAVEVVAIEEGPIVIVDAAQVCTRLHGKSPYSKSCLASAPPISSNHTRIRTVPWLSLRRTRYRSTGKRLFPDDGVLRPMENVDHEVTTTGAMLATYASTAR